MVKKVIPDIVFAVSGLLGSPPVLFIQKLTEMSRHSSLSFLFYFPRKAFFTARLSGWPMNSLPHLHSFRITVSPSGVMTFLTGRRLGKNGLLVGMGA
jgi:hypothetical protein